MALKTQIENDNIKEPSEVKKQANKKIDEFKDSLANYLSRNTDNQFKSLNDGKSDIDDTLGNIFLETKDNRSADQKMQDFQKDISGAVHGTTIDQQKMDELINKNKTYTIDEYNKDKANEKINKRNEGFEERKQQIDNYEDTLYGYTDQYGQKHSTTEGNARGQKLDVDLDAYNKKYTDIVNALNNGEIDSTRAYDMIAALEPERTRLENEINELSSWNYGFYDLQSEQEKNSELMNDLTKQKHELLALRGSISEDEYLESLNNINEQMNNLNERNELLSKMIGDQDLMNVNASKEYIESGEASMDERREFYDKQSSYTTEWTDWFDKRLKYLYTVAPSVLGGGIAVYDTAKDFFLEKFGQSMQKNAQNRYDKGDMSLENYNSIVDTAQKYIDFSANAEDNWSTKIKDFVAKQRENVYYGQENEWKIAQYLGQAIDQTGQFLSEFYLAGGNETASLLMMSFESGTDVAYQDLANGKSIDTAAFHGALRGTLSYMTEKVGMDNFVNAISGQLAQQSIGTAIDYIGKSVLKQGTAEGLEEVVEWFFTPLVDSISASVEQGKFVMDTSGWGEENPLNAFAIAFLSASITGLWGGVAGTYNFYNNIVDGKGASNVLAARNYMETLLTEKADTLNDAEVAFIKHNIAMATEALNNFDGKSAIGSSVRYVNDFNNTDGRSIMSKVEESLVTGITSDFEAKVNEYHSYIDAVNTIKQVTQKMLNNNNIKGSATQYLQMSPENRAAVTEIADMVRGTKYTIAISSRVEVNGEVKSGYEGLIMQGNNIVVSPYTKNGVLATITHELTHTIQNTENYEFLKNSILEKKYGDNKEALNKEIEKIQIVYKNTVDQDLTREEAIQEIVANSYADFFGTEEFLSKLFKSDKGAFAKLFDRISNYLTKNPSAEIEEKYVNSFYQVMAENTTGGADARFSMKIADKIAREQVQMVENKKSSISIEEVLNAQDVTNQMIKYIQSFEDWETLMPEDIIGKILLDDASYGKSVENSTICPRTLAYNELINLVSEKVGRPLTATESMMVSQMLYEIAVEPQCLYCYVALDRKSFNDFTKKYIEQRDEAIQKYKDAGSPKLFKPQLKEKYESKSAKRKAEKNAAILAAQNNELFAEFLNGREASYPMWERYSKWIEYANNGTEMIQMYDLASDRTKQLAMEKSDEFKYQVEDALKYAQGSSWAKKSFEYRSYYNDIRKLSDAKVRQLNKHYGLRWYSFNDFSAAYIVENMQQFTDAAIRGLKGLAYTKDCAFARIFAPTGCNINISVFVNKRADGTFYIDPVQSADLEEAIELRKKYPNVGIVATSTDFDGVNWALNQEWTDVVIPFHIVRTGQDISDYYKWTVFNEEQNDTINDKEIWKKYVKSVVGDSEAKRKKVSKNVYPSEHQNDIVKYTQLCKERGIKPRFSSFLSNPNYMKLVNETRMAEGVTPKLKAEFDIEAAKNSFEAFADKGGFYGGWFRTDVEAEWYKGGDIKEAASDQVARDILDGLTAKDTSYGTNNPFFKDDKYKEMIRRVRKVKQHGIRFSISMDNEYTDAIKNRDYGKAQRMVDQAALDWGAFTDENGLPKLLYHGTMDTSFTTFDMDISQNAIFLTDNLENASSYSGSMREDSLNDYYWDNEKGKELQKKIETINNINDANIMLKKDISSEMVIKKDGNKYKLFTQTDFGFDMAIAQYDNLQDVLAYAENYVRDTNDANTGNSSRVTLLNGIGTIGNYSLYAKSENPLIIEGNGTYWSELPLEAKTKDGETITIDGIDYLEEGRVLTRDWCNYAIKNGYDSVVFKDIIDYGGANIDADTSIPSNIYAVFSSEQVKSADRVTYDDNGIIPLSERFNDNNEDIRYSISTDSEGNTLSAQQRSYFKDSKVLDNNGNLMLMYHGTNAEFNEFSRDFIGKTGAFEGAGFNFTPYEGRATSYGKNVKTGYLNITNPLSSTKITMTPSKLAKIIIEADPTGDNIISNYARETRDYGTQNFIKREAMTTANQIIKYNESDVDIYSELSAASGGDTNLISVFEKMGYDGLLHLDENGNIKTAIAFNSNQFKNADNTNPTSNPDVRYSISEENQKKMDGIFDKVVDFAKTHEAEYNDFNESMGWIEGVRNDAKKLIESDKKKVNAAQKVRKEFIDNVNKWCPRYDLIKSKYGSLFSQYHFNKVLYQLTVEGNVDEKLREQLAKDIVKYDTEGKYAGKDIKEGIQDFVDDVVNYIAADQMTKTDKLAKKVAKRTLDVTEGTEQKATDNYEEHYDEQEKIVKSQEHAKEVKKTFGDYIEELCVNLANFGKKVDVGNLTHKTFSQVLEKIGGTNTALTEQLKDKLLGRERQAKQKHVETYNKYNDKLQSVIKDYGIKGGTNESRLLQFYMEQHTNELKPFPDNSASQEDVDNWYANPWVEYTLEDLKKDANYKMKNGRLASDNIVDAAVKMQEMYKDFYLEINEAQMEVYGDAVGQKEYELATLSKKIRETYGALNNLIREMNGKNHSSETYKKLEAGYDIASKEIRDLVDEFNALNRKLGNNDAARRQITPYRQNYTHHIGDNGGFFKKLEKAFKGESNVPSEFAGIKNNTHPNSALRSLMLKQGTGAYKADAIESMAAYINEASQIVAYDGYINNMRTMMNRLRTLDTSGNNSGFLKYMNKYLEDIAGRRSGLDASISEDFGEKPVKIMQTFVSQSKKAILSFNVRSMLVQTSNIPNAVGILVERGGASAYGSFGKGMADYLATWNKNTNNKTSKAMKDSVFLQERFMSINTHNTSLKSNINNAIGFMLSAFDEMSTKMIWCGAYNQAIHKGESDAVAYADEITRDSVAGRGVGEVPVALKSSIFNMLVPFQIETNNQWQVLKRQLSNKQYGAVLTAQALSFLLNSVFIGIGMGDALPELITPFVKEITKYRKNKDDDDEKNDITMSQLVYNIAIGEAGEALSMIPGASSIMPFFVDEETSESIFGDYNVSRYGTQMLGAKGIGDLAKDSIQTVGSLAEGDYSKALGNALTLATDYTKNYVPGGNQLVKTTQGLQSMGALPSWNVSEGKFEKTAANYTDSGNIRYVNDTDNIADWLKSGLFGKWQTSQAQEYIDSGFKSTGGNTKRMFDVTKEEISNEYNAFNKAKEILDTEEWKYVNPDGETKTISNSNALQVRKHLEDLGLYDNVLEKINSSEDLKPTSYGLSDAVIGMNDKEFQEAYEKAKSEAGSMKEGTSTNIYNAIVGKFDDNTEAYKKATEINSITSLKTTDGETITNSKALQIREQYELLGVYDDIIKLIEEGKATPSDYGLNKTVVGYNKSSYEKALKDAREKSTKASGKNEEKDTSYVGTKTGSGGSSGKNTKYKVSTTKNYTKDADKIVDYIRSAVGSNSSNGVQGTISNILKRLSNSSNDVADNIAQLKKKRKSLK